MSEGLGGAPKGDDAAGPQAGGMPVATVPTTKRFFLTEYFDEVRRGFKWMLSSPKPDTAMANKVRGGLVNWSKLRKARIGVGALVVIMLLSYGLFSVQAGSTALVSGKGPLPPGATGNGVNETFSGTVAENSNVSKNTKDIAPVVTAFRVTLTWTDAAARFPLTNEKDNLGLGVKAPNGMTWSVPVSNAGAASWTLPDTTVNYGAGPWNITIVGGDMGDVDRPGIPGPCPGCHADTQGDFSVKYEATW